MCLSVEFGPTRAGCKSGKPTALPSPVQSCSVGPDSREPGKRGACVVTFDAAFPEERDGHAHPHGVPEVSPCVGSGPGSYQTDSVRTRCEVIQAPQRCRNSREANFIYQSELEVRNRCCFLLSLLVQASIPRWAPDNPLPAPISPTAPLTPSISSSTTTTTNAPQEGSNTPKAPPIIHPLPQEASAKKKGPPGD